MSRKRVVTKVAEDEWETIKPGYIRDYVSGVWVKATPEETELVQVFARRLVEDYGYPKSCLQTRPQYRVRKRPSDEAKSYPVDIAVFKGQGRAEGDLYLVVECKKKNKKDGVAQLKLYLDMSPAELGVWFNGDEHVYLRKIHKRSGAREYHELPNIPRYSTRRRPASGCSRRNASLAPTDKPALTHPCGLFPEPRLLMPLDAPACPVAAHRAPDAPHFRLRQRHGELAVEGSRQGQ